MMRGFRDIFLYEFGHWLRQPIVYLLGLSLFAVAFVSFVGTAGGFDGGDAGVAPAVPVNAPVNIVSIAIVFSTYFMVLVPAISGVAVSRDFNSGIHNVLYSLPFRKWEYVAAKYLSSTCTVILIVAAVLAGFLVAETYPGLDPNAVSNTVMRAYLQALLFFLIPNVVFFTIAIFAVSSASRNVYTGFVVVILILIAQKLLGGMLRAEDTRVLAALLDPTGDAAVEHITRYWDATDKADKLIPMNNALLWNRVIWLSASIGIAMVSYWFVGPGRASLRLPIIGRSKNRARDRSVAGPASGALPGEDSYHYGWRSSIKIMLSLSRHDFRYVITNWSFLVLLAGSALIVVLMLLGMNPQYAGRLLPVSWKIVEFPIIFFTGVINIITFIYSGMLVNRARSAKMDHLIGVTPVPDWCLVVSRLLALIKVQLFILAVIMVGCIGVQFYRDFYEIDVAHYIFRLFAVNSVGFIVWAFVAISVHMLVSNQYTGIFILVAFMLGVSVLPDLGVHDSVFRFNTSPGGLRAYVYSAMDGYGGQLPLYFSYKFYWLAGAIGVFIVSTLFWVRGASANIRERLKLGRKRFTVPKRVGVLALAAVFLLGGARLYYVQNVKHEKPWSSEQYDWWTAENEKRFKRYAGLPQPVVSFVDVDVKIYPEERRFQIDGSYLLTNPGDDAIDTMVVAGSFNEATSIRVDRHVKTVVDDSLMRMDVLVLNESLLPGDSLTMYFTVESRSPNWVQTHSKVRRNGTYIPSTVLPAFGYRNVELKGADKRKQYGLGASPDSLESQVAKHRSVHDMANLRIEITTDSDQVAIAPGELTRSSVANGRRTVLYETKAKVRNRFAIQSAGYHMSEFPGDSLSISIFHHPQQVYNVSSIEDGIRTAVDYGNEHFGRFPFERVRVAEFPLTEGTYATLFANMIPMSEINFIAEVADDVPGAINLPFYIAAHELAHHWWGGVLEAADGPGSKMLSESLAEYVALRVLRDRYGEAVLRNFLQLDRDLYLGGRADEEEEEYPLVKSLPHQDYINYRKGGLTFYALSEYLGEDILNDILRSFITEYSGSENLPVAEDLYLMIRERTPDSLKGIVASMFEEIAVYDNRIRGVEFTPSEDGVTTRVEMAISVEPIFFTNKHQVRNWTDSQMSRTDYRLPVTLLVEIEIEGLPVEREFDFMVVPGDTALVADIDGLPSAVVLDPNGFLLDKDMDDNRFVVDE